MASSRALISGSLSPQLSSQNSVRLADVRMRDTCILADATTQTYYAVYAYHSREEGTHHSPEVRVLASSDLVNWEGPQSVFTVSADIWTGANVRGIWAPEMHAYKGRYYLFLTFDTDTPLPEQWRDWLPRVKRASQVLISDSPRGPFRPFHPHPTLPEDMMTLDGTLWIEYDVPYMVYCHEWVQIKDGTVECIQLTDDLSETVGEPVRLFHGSDATWAKKSPRYGCTVTDGPYLYRSKSGRLFMVWSSGGAHGYTTGVAISDSGHLRGPWRHPVKPLFTDDGGHPMIFKRFDGQLMLALHQPNVVGQERTRLFELEDTGDTLRITAPFPPTDADTGDALPQAV